MYKNILKRTLDILISVVFLPVLIVFLLIVSPLIWFNDKGNIFYKSKRRGRDGVPFTMYKFRSMKVNAPDLRNKDNSTFNSENDSRVTKVGRILRKTSIDEIPQVINVLKGDMSWVGPRPDMATREYSELNDVEKKRITVRPGITGFTQAYYRNSITKDEKYAYDLYYIEHVSFVFDIKIIVQTFMSVLKRKNINAN